MTTQRPVVLITGGGRGIGFGVAQALAAEGCDLVLSGRREEAAVQEAVAALKEHGGEVMYCRGDVGDAGDRARMLAEVRAHYGRLHVLVNNAGVGPRERVDLLEATEESFDEVLRINLRGAYFLTQAAARWMIEQAQADTAFAGCIINISSISATVASPSRGEYCVAKAGLSMATKLWAVRLGAFGIPVYELRPGVTRTDMTAGVTEQYDALIADGLTLQPRWGLPADVGRAAAMLVRGDMPYSTGAVLMIDGGLTVPRL